MLVTERILIALHRSSGVSDGLVEAGPSHHGLSAVNQRGTKLYDIEGDRFIAEVDRMTGEDVREQKKQD